jgi:hypothetical protein
LMSVCCECCVLSGRGLCNALITRPEESYGLWCIVVCDLEISRMGRPWPASGRSATGAGCNYKCLNNWCFNSINFCIKRIDREQISYTSSYRTNDEETFHLSQIKHARHSASQKINLIKDTSCTISRQLDLRQTAKPLPWNQTVWLFRCGGDPASCYCQVWTWLWRGNSLNR